MKSAFFIAISFVFFATFAMGQDSTTNDIQRVVNSVNELSSRLEDLEREISNEEFLERVEAAKSELQILSDGLSSIGRQVSLGQMFLSGQFFVIFGTIITVSGLVAGIVANYTMRLADQKIEAIAEDTISDRVVLEIENAAPFVIGKAHGQQAFAWWDHYQNDYQKFLTGKTVDTDVLLREISFSKDISAKGLEQLGLVKGPLADHKQTIQLKAELLNHWVYNRTAELLLLKETNTNQTDEDEDEVRRLLDRAVKCMQYSYLDVLEKYWPYYVETAQFCFLKFGSEGEKNQARQLLLSLFPKEPQAKPERKTSPNEKFVKLAADFYFPIDESSNSRQDIHGLGKVPDSVADV